MRPMRRRHSSAKRTLRTVLFTDIVGSTELAAQLGDRAWRQLLSRHHDRMRRMLRRHGGREVDTTGDGFFAVFEEPEDSLQCALEIQQAVADLGIKLRAGLHIGETETIDGKVGGVAVHIAARIMARAGAGDVLVSGTLSELVAGSGIEFEDLGQNELKGVPGSWRIMRAVPPELTVEEPVVSSEATRSISARLLALVAIAVAVLSVAGALVLMMGERAPSTAAGPNTIVRIDPASNSLSGAIRVGSGPVALAAGDGYMWVANLDDQTVSRIDLARGVEVARPGGVGVPVSVAVAGDGAWVTDMQGALYHVDARSNRATRVLSEVRGGSAVAAGEGWLWVLDGIGDRVMRVDSTTRQLSRTVALPAGSGATGIAVGEGGVWVANGLINSVSRIDPGGVDVTVEHIALCCRPSAISVGGGYVWVSSAESDTIQRITPASNSVSLTLAVGDGPAAVAADESAVWVANAYDRSLQRLNHDGAQVALLDLPGQPTAAIVLDGVVWLALRSPD